MSDAPNDRLQCRENGDLGGLLGISRLLFCASRPFNVVTTRAPRLASRAATDVPISPG